MSRPFKYLHLIWLCWFAHTAQAQQVITLDSFLSMVKQQHPMMQRADLRSRQVAAYEQAARGHFDPKLFGSFKEKSFDGKNYYQIGDGGVKVPLPFGAEVKAGYAWTNGDYFNPEKRTPTNGQAYAGMEIALWQGLLFDERRAALREAELYESDRMISRQQLLNDVLLDASTAYLNWSYYESVLDIHENAYTLAVRRFNWVKDSYLQGDKPAMDTLEAAILVQNRWQEAETARLNAFNARIALQDYLWSADGSTMAVNDWLPVREAMFLEATRPLSDSLVLQPEQSALKLQALQLKQQQLRIKERLKREERKPLIDVHFNLLANGFDFMPEGSENNNFTALLTENYKWGVKVSYPLLNRKANGGLELIRLQQLELSYQYVDERRRIQNKLRIFREQLATTRQQITLQEKILQEYIQLTALEQEKFRLGESSVFLLNNREQKLIQARLKVLKLNISYQKAWLKARWTAGILP